MNFGSDNQSGASDPILNAIVKANNGRSSSYGTDACTLQAEAKLKEIFECDLSAYFLASGTAANCLALASMVAPHEQILCHEHAHIINDELTAPEFYTGGARMRGFDLHAPKLQLSSLQSYLSNFEGHDPHTAAPAVLSLTQLSETGCAYTIDEISALVSVAKAHDLKVHMDGARFANALVGLGCTPAEMTWKRGVDVLCLGASKNGALAAEAVIFFDQSLADGFEFKRKRAGHLLSKGRLLGAQFGAWLEDEHWLELARHSNRQASKLADGLRQSDFAQLVWPVDGNEVFAEIDKERISALRTHGAIFYEWPERFLGDSQRRVNNAALVRLVTSFTSSDSEIERFIGLLG